MLRAVLVVQLLLHTTPPPECQRTRQANALQRFEQAEFTHALTAPGLPSSRSGADCQHVPSGITNGVHSSRAHRHAWVCQWLAGWHMCHVHEQGKVRAAVTKVVRAWRPGGRGPHLEGAVRGVQALHDGAEQRLVVKRDVRLHDLEQKRHQHELEGQPADHREQRLQQSRVHLLHRTAGGVLISHGWGWVGMGGGEKQWLKHAAWLVWLAHASSARRDVGGGGGGAPGRRSGR